MSIMRRPAGDRLVLSPMEPLTAGGSAESFDVSGQLMDAGAGVKSVTWENPKRERA